MTPELLGSLRRNAGTFIHRFLRVKTKASTIAPLITDDFPAQADFVRVVQEQRHQKKPVRIVGLKARQVGLTSIADGLVYHATSLWPDVFSVIVSSDLASAQSIHEKNDLFWEFSPEWVRPSRSRSSRREMMFDTPRGKGGGLRSRIFVESARKVTIGRSHTIQCFLGSEVAFWKDGEERAVAVMNSVPEIPGTMIVMESTANGIGGFFYDLYNQAKQKKSGWVAWFFPWWKQPEYRRKPDPSFHADDLSKEEEELVKQFKLDREQITWRRYMIAAKFGGDEDVFRQEYPSTDEEAFLVSGRPAFDRLRIRAQEGNLKAGQPIRLFPVNNGRISAEPARQSPLLIWDKPLPGHPYVVGADPAAGAENDERKDHPGDFNAAVVIDALSSKQVAQLHTSSGPIEFAMQLDLLGRFYNDAKMVVERNGDGVNVVARLAEVYPNLYYEQSYEEVEWGPIKNRVGWISTDEKKRLIINELGDALRLGLICLRSADLLEELRAFERDSKGRYGAKHESHDDLVIALAMAWWVAKRENVGLKRIDSDDFLDPAMVRWPLEHRMKAYQVRAAAYGDR